VIKIFIIFDVSLYFPMKNYEVILKSNMKNEKEEEEDYYEERFKKNKVIER